MVNQFNLLIGSFLDIFKYLFRMLRIPLHFLKKLNIIWYHVLADA